MFLFISILLTLIYIDINKANNAYKFIKYISFNIITINIANATKSKGNVEFEYNSIDNTVVDDEEDIIVEEEDANKVTDVAKPFNSAAPILTSAYIVALFSFLTLFKLKEVIEIFNINDNIIIISVCEAPLDLYAPEDELELCFLNCKEIYKMLIEILYSSIIRVDVITF